jgi:UDP:flavonoid glycosyltransferase YjiC (YdhE family)
LGKPAVYVPIYNHSEQIWNAEKCARLGIGIELKSENSNADRLVECVESCINDSKYKHNAEKLKSISSQHNGLETTAGIIRSYL